MKLSPWCAVLLALAGCGGGSDGLGDLDPRCETLCDGDDPMCSEDVALCQDVCQVRVAGVESLCATCLLEGSHNGTCPPEGPCCPDPVFETSVNECADACEDSSGVNPSEHPACVALCSSDDPSCDKDVAQCLEECHARIEGVSGLCATCLLEGSHGGVCAPDAPCCPDPVFEKEVADCAAVCS